MTNKARIASGLWSLSLRSRVLAGAATSSLVSPPPPALEPKITLTAQQKKTGLAAWLGWMFDGLDMHLYTLVAAPFVMILIDAGSTADPLVKEKSSWIQAAFLVG